MTEAEAATEQSEAPIEPALPAEPPLDLASRAAWDRFSIRGLDDARLFAASGPDGEFWAVASSAGADARPLDLARARGLVVTECLNPLCDELRSRT